MSPIRSARSRLKSRRGLLKTLIDNSPGGGGTPRWNRLPAFPHADPNIIVAKENFRLRQREKVSIQY